VEFQRGLRVHVGHALRYSSSYLGFLVEIVREVFPFGASAPDKKHYYTVVLHIILGSD
jgi:hypothetical protein